ncbi:MAG: M20/M25/M40 family metallo-hydrolase, partial [Woeseiaceae bacterium]
MFRLLTITLLLFAHTSFAQEHTAPEVLPNYVAETQSIMADRRVQSALEHIVAIEPQSRRNLIELTEIPAPPFEEQARAERFAQMLRESGLTDVSIDDVGNAVGRRPGRSGDRVIGYSAHLDTVFPADTDVTVRFDDEKMYAPG